MAEPVSVFKDVQQDARGHLGLLFYAAAYHLIFCLRSRALAAGETLERVWKDYPFLTGFFETIRERLPDEIGWTESLGWLRAQIEAWETAVSSPLPILEVRRALQLPPEAALMFILAGMVEEEAQFADLFGAVQQPQGERRVSVGFLQRLFEETVNGDCWKLIRPLVDAGFLQVPNREHPRSEWVLRVPQVLWNAVRGECAESPLPGVHFYRPESLQALPELVVDSAVRSQLTEFGTLAAAAHARTLVVRGMPGTDRLGAVGAVANGLGRGLLEIECDSSAPIPEERRLLLSPLCTLLHAIPVFSVEAGPCETFEIPALAGYQGLCAVLIGQEGGIGGPSAAHAVTVNLDLESPADRLKLWTRALTDQKPSDISAIASGFCLPARYIRQCARLATDYAAMERRACICVADVRRAARAINRQVLDTLAMRIDGPAGFSQLVVREATLRELEMLEGRCRFRENLAATFDASIPGGMNRGVRALFEGPSGTGKTLAARVLATELGLDLYRVDLAAVVNKYIGETEKNLSRVLSRAEDLNVILLLDEGDALMGRRTDVKSANDRYANLETNYLLQRLETYTGIVIVTTNAGHAIDSAFRRRIDSVVKFHLPDSAERWRLWQAHLPSGHEVPETILEEISVRYQLTGGQIRNIGIRAGLLALARKSGPVRAQELGEAIQAEHRKAGSTFVEIAGHEAPRNERSIATFLGGLS